MMILAWFFNLCFSILGVAYQITEYNSLGDITWLMVFIVFLSATFLGEEINRYRRSAGTLTGKRLAAYEAKYRVDTY